MGNVEGHYRPLFCCYIQVSENIYFSKNKLNQSLPFDTQLFEVGKFILAFLTWHRGYLWSLIFENVGNVCNVENEKNLITFNTFRATKDLCNIRYSSSTKQLHMCFIENYNFGQSFHYTQATQYSTTLCCFLPGD